MPQFPNGATQHIFDLIKFVIVKPKSQSVRRRRRIITHICQWKSVWLCGRVWGRKRKKILKRAKDAAILHFEGRGAEHEAEQHAGGLRGTKCCHYWPSFWDYSSTHTKLQCIGIWDNVSRVCCTEFMNVLASCAAFLHALFPPLLDLISEIPSQSSHTRQAIITFVDTAVALEGRPDVFLILYRVQYVGVSKRNGEQWVLKKILARSNWHLKPILLSDMAQSRHFFLIWNFINFILKCFLVPNILLYLRYH